MSVRPVSRKSDIQGDIDKLIFLGGRVDFPSPYAVKGGASRNGSVLVVQSGKDALLSASEYILLSELKANNLELL